MLYTTVPLSSEPKHRCCAGRWRVHTPGLETCSWCTLLLPSVSCVRHCHACLNVTFTLVPSCTSQRGAKNHHNLQNTVTVFCLLAVHYACILPRHDLSTALLPAIQEPGFVCSLLDSLQEHTTPQTSFACAQAAAPHCQCPLSKTNNVMLQDSVLL